MALITDGSAFVSIDTVLPMLRVGNDDSIVVNNFLKGALSLVIELVSKSVEVILVMHRL